METKPDNYFLLLLSSHGGLWWPACKVSVNESFVSRCSSLAIFRLLGTEELVPHDMQIPSSTISMQDLLLRPCIEHSRILLGMIHQVPLSLQSAHVEGMKIWNEVFSYSAPPQQTTTPQLSSHCPENFTGSTCACGSLCPSCSMAAVPAVPTDLPQILPTPEPTASMVSSVVQKRQGVISWDDYFMSVAFLSAMRSKDPSTQVGACIVNPDQRIVGM